MIGADRTWSNAFSGCLVLWLVSNAAPTPALSARQRTAADHELRRLARIEDRPKRSELARQWLEEYGAHPQRAEAVALLVHRLDPDAQGRFLDDDRVVTWAATVSDALSAKAAKTAHPIPPP